MNNSRGDLSLFYVFRALMEERHVGRAAEQLGLTQPAVSNALNRLRLALHDPLFLRTQGGMKPTRKALEIWPEVHASVDSLSAIMFPGQFNPSETTTTYRIAVTDALRRDLIASLSAAFVAHAPRAQLQFHHHTNQTSSLALQNGEIDCSVGMFPRLLNGLNVMPLLTDDYVCVMRRDHPLSRGCFTIEDFTAAQHVLSKPSGIGAGTIDHWLALHGLDRRVTVVVTYFSDALGIVASTDMLGCVPQRYLDKAGMADMGVVSRPLPFDTERILFKLVWHERTDCSGEHIWLRRLILDQFPSASLAAVVGPPSPIPSG